MPFIFRWPGRIKAGAVCDEPIISVDLFPTLMELAQANPPANQPLDGLSLVPLLLGRESTLKRDALYWHFPGYLGSGHNVWRTTPAGAIRVGDDKLLEFSKTAAWNSTTCKRTLARSMTWQAASPSSSKCSTQSCGTGGKRSVHRCRRGKPASLRLPAPSARPTACRNRVV